MIDTHIHIIPAVDDGSKDIKMSLDMLDYIMKEGVTGVIATPHYHDPVFLPENVEEQYKLLKDEIDKRGLDFKLYLGNEIRLNQECMPAIEDGRARRMAGSDYLLIELPTYMYYPFHDELLFKLQLEGYKIIIAHCERYKVFEDEKKIIEMMDRGIYLQLSSAYITKKRTRTKALNLIRKGYITLVCSDGHNLDRRKPDLKESYDIVAKKFGTECANLLYTENPSKIISNEEFKVPIIKENKKFGIF